MTRVGWTNNKFFEVKRENSCIELSRYYQALLLVICQAVISLISLSYITQMTRTTKFVYKRGAHGKQAKMNGSLIDHFIGLEIVLCGFRHSTFHARKI